MDLNLVRLIFTLNLEADCVDSHVLFGLKPYFMEAFRVTAGCVQPDSELSLRRCDCLYHRMVSQHLSAEPAALKRYQKPSYPFVFDIPEIPPPPNAGRTVELGLTLAGMAANHTEEFIATVQGMLTIPGIERIVRATLVRVEAAGYDGNRTPIMAEGGTVARGEVVTLSLRGLRETMIIPADAVTLAIMTPMRIMGEGRPLREFTFSPFIRALLRRISSLVYYYGGEETDLDFKWLAGQSLAVRTVAADFRWVDRGSKLSGLLGMGTFVGIPPEYHTFLLAGEYLHVGKGASYGLGAYRVNKTA
jgi:CRISPR-associated endoribonuclease Cas6